MFIVADLVSLNIKRGNGRFSENAYPDKHQS